MHKHNQQCVNEYTLINKQLRPKHHMGNNNKDNVSLMVDNKESFAKMNIKNEHKTIKNNVHRRDC